jgi:hypothetical protein
MSIEAMKQALEALEKTRDENAAYLNFKEPYHEAITTLRTAIEEAEKQEPVAFLDWYDNATWGNEDFKTGCHRAWNAAIKYTTPPAAQRQWVGLTDEEREVLLDNYITAEGRARAIEAKLKDKNNG